MQGEKLDDGLAAAGSTPLGGGASGPSGIRIPSPLASAPPTLIAIGTYPARSVEAEEFGRRIGNWGSASRDIGDRWEVVGVARLRAQLPWSVVVGGGRSMTVDRVLTLDSGAAGAALQRAGISAPDLLLIGQVATSSGPRLAVRAADLKVSLDTAERVQTAAARLPLTFARIASGLPQVATALLEQARLLDTSAPVAEETVRQALAGQWSEIAVIEGLFIAPDTGYNRWYLQELEHRRRTGRAAPRLPYRGRRRDETGTTDLAEAGPLPAHLEVVTSRDFLGVLPGWPETAVIAELDGVHLESADPAIVERCWRVANGLRGAILAIGRRLFDPSSEYRTAAGEHRDVVPLLRRLIPRKSGRSDGLVRAVDDLLTRRRGSWEEEALRLAFPVSYDAWSQAYDAFRQIEENGSEIDPDLSEALNRLGFDARADNGSDADLEGRQRTVTRLTRGAHRGAQHRHRARVIAVARESYAQGDDEATVMAMLTARQQEWIDAAMADAARTDISG